MKKLLLLLALAFSTTYLVSCDDGEVEDPQVETPDDGTDGDGTGSDGDVVSVAIDQKDMELMLGDSVVLTVTVTGDDDTSVTWSSSDQSVATVSSDGTVTPVAEGEVTITATSVADDTKSASITITVVDEDETSDPASEVSVSIVGADQSINDGESLTLTATVTNDEDSKGVTWSSSNESVAKIDPASGAITTVGPGTTIITATSVADTSKSDTVNITVIELPTDVDVDGNIDEWETGGSLNS